MKKALLIFAVLIVLTPPAKKNKRRFVCMPTPFFVEPVKIRSRTQADLNQTTQVFPEMGME